MNTWFGVLNGLALESSDIQDREAVLVINSLAEAKRVLLAAANSWYSSYIRRNLDGKYPGDIPGGLGEDASLTLWAMPNPDEVVGYDVATQWEYLVETNTPGDIYPDYVLTIGPRGGARVERA